MKMKKIVVVFSALIFLLLGVLFYIKSFQIKEIKNCPFCDRKVIEAQKYFEDDIVMGLYSHKPVIKGHCLIIPKRHVERLEELTLKEQENIFELIRKTNSAMQKIENVNSYMILQKNGKEVGQSVPHLHFHYIPNKQNGSNLSFLFRFVIAPFKGKINQNEMEKMTKRISENL